MANNVNPFEVRTFIGLSPYNVEIDDTPELQKLMSEAEACQELRFEEKLKAVQEIAVKAMKNAYEGMMDVSKIKYTWFGSDPNTDSGFEFFSKCTDIVDYSNPLGEALKAGAGCCRYQATLFLLLGAAAKLGDKHYLQSTVVHSRLDTCYNDVVYEGKVHHVSIFVSSIENKKYDYTVSVGPEIFEKPHKECQGEPFLAYTVDNESAVHRFVRKDRHFDSL